MKERDLTKNDEKGKTPEETKNENIIKDRIKMQRMTNKTITRNGLDELTQDATSPLQT